MQSIELAKMIYLEAKKLQELVMEHGTRDKRYSPDLGIEINNKGQIKRDIIKIRADLISLLKTYK